jgi:hypothetical protein
VEKYCIAEQATDGSMAHEFCMLNNQDYKHTHRICNTCCFSTATMVTRTRDNVTYVRTLSVLFQNEMVKGKAVPLQAWNGPEGSRKLRFPDFMTTAQDGGKVVSLRHRPSLPSRNTPGTNFY